MEMFGADDADQWSVIQRTIDASDYYIVIIGHRYGSTAKNKKSYTENEFDYAKKRKIPILAFIRDKDVPTKQEERETKEDLMQRLDSFIKKASKGRMCKFWKTESDLINQISISLPKFIAETPRVGWVRADTIPSQNVSEELAALSQENRKLKQLLQHTEVASPKFKISLGEALSFSEADYILPPTNEVPKNIDYNDIGTENLEFIGKHNIDTYNRLISEQGLIAFNKEVALFKRIKSAKTITINIKNIGEKKATNVNLLLEFPKNFALIKSDIYEFVETFPPVHPKQVNPVDMLNELLKSGKSGREIRSEIDKKIKMFSKLTSQRHQLLQSIDKRDEFKVDKNVSIIKIGKNQLAIEFSQLMHTLDFFVSPNYLVFPISRGEGVIKASVIAEEMATNQTFELPITYNL